MDVLQARHDQRLTGLVAAGGPMSRTMAPADRARLEQGLKRWRLRRIREMLDPVGERALQEKPSYLDFLGAEGRAFAKQRLHNYLDVLRAPSSLWC